MSGVNSPTVITICLILAVSALAHSLPAIEEKKTDFQANSQQVGKPNEDDNSFLGLLNMFGGGNPRTTPNGQTLIEGDIAIANDTNEAPSPRKAVPDSSLYWPGAEVVYTYHESITPGEMTVIEAAMQHWRQHTCITFRPRQANDLVFVRFRSDTQGCWSLVGRQVNSPNGYGQGQDVSIGQGCANLNVVVHEIGHVLGFFHEQSRSDRDQYIDIVWGNVLPGYGLQFRKETDTNFGIPYDLTSTMQYPQWAFSKEIFEKSTIVARNPAYQRFLSKNYPLSFRDRLLANQMYSCTRMCQGAGAGCQNGGYMRTTGGAGGELAGGRACSCDCPPNFAGPNCERRIRSDYYEELPCGGPINRPGRIETPGYPQRIAPGQSCMWDIRAPAGRVVSIKFDGFEFAPRFTKPGTKVINKCFNETVELRLRNSNIYDGEVYCGTDIAPGTVMRSDGPHAVIIITANDKMIGSGLRASIRFVRRNELVGGDDKEDGEEVTEVGGGETITQTPAPFDEISTINPATIYTTPGVFTVTPDPEEPPVINTLPPIFPPRPPPQPPTGTVVTSSSLLEEYEKESKKTLPPVIPFARFN